MQTGNDSLLSAQSNCLYLLWALKYVCTGLYVWNNVQVYLSQIIMGKKKTRTLQT